MAFEQLLGLALVADEVVVHHEDLAEAEAVDLLDLGHHLGHRLGARPPPVHHDDVAELAVEGAAPGELDGHGPVAVDLQEVEAGQRRVEHAGLLVLAVLGLPGARRVVLQELRPRVLRLVHEDHVDLAAQLLRAERGEGAADHHELPAPPELRDDLEHPLLVDDVPGDAHDVGVGVEVDRLDVLVTQDDVVLPGGETGHRGEREVRIDAALVQAGQHAVERPEGLGIPRSDEINFHAILPGSANDPRYGTRFPAVLLSGFVVRCPGGPRASG